MLLHLQVSRAEARAAQKAQRVSRCPQTNPRKQARSGADSAILTGPVETSNLGLRLKVLLENNCYAAKTIERIHYPTSNIFT